MKGSNERGVRSTSWASVTGAFYVGILLLLLLGHSGWAQTPEFDDAVKSDPNRLMLMRGSPPPATKTVRVTDGTWREFPYSRWAFSHTRELLPSADVWRGDAPVSKLPRAERDLDEVAYTDLDGHPRTWAQMLSLTWTDGIIVLYQGRVVYEKYFGALAPNRQHIDMSVTKSFGGTLAAMLAARGKLEVSAPVTKYVPELKSTAWADATVQQVMDMTVGVDYSEDYADPNSGISNFLRAGGFLPIDANYKGPQTLYDFILTLKKSGAHGARFDYKSPNAQVLAWVLKRITGQPLSTLLSQEIWQKLGAEEDAYYVVDSVGTEQASGGLNTTLRDLARFGEMMRNDGRFNGQQIVPASVVADIRKGGDRDKFAITANKALHNWSYHNQWWISDWGAFCALGINGQALYIDPKSELVIARYASHPLAPNGANHAVSLPAYRAIGTYLTAH
jgi:CubicO group peptidase (beta-lactamase class C family)